MKLDEAQCPLCMLIFIVILKDCKIKRGMNTSCDAVGRAAPSATYFPFAPSL